MFSLLTSSNGCNKCSDIVFNFSIPANSFFGGDSSTIDKDDVEPVVLLSVRLCLLSLMKLDEDDLLLALNDDTTSLLLFSTMNRSTDVDGKYMASVLCPSFFRCGKGQKFMIKDYLTHHSVQILR